MPEASAFQFAAWAMAALLLVGGSGEARGSRILTFGLCSSGMEEPRQKLSPRANARPTLADLYKMSSLTGAPMIDGAASSSLCLLLRLP